MKPISALLAMVLATDVFPQPSGPHNNIPQAEDKPNVVKYSGYLIDMPATNKYVVNIRDKMDCVTSVVHFGVVTQMFDRPPAKRHISMSKSRI